MMNVDINVGTHGMAYPNNVLAQHYGEHMFSLEIDSDVDNGWLVSVGDYVDLNTYKAVLTDVTFTGKIVAQMTDGNYLVVVDDPGNAVLVYNKPLTPYDSPAALKDEKSMYNKAGDRVRAYGLHKFDKFEESVENFSGTPAVGKKITGVTNGKLVVETTA